MLLRRMKAPLIVLILAFAISVLGFVLIPGQDDKGQPWSMSFMHAFYVVTYTASTIGFGELPYLFTDAQRLWATAVIFISVIAWMYAIGTLLALVQEPGLRALVRELAFRRAVRRVVEPFYLVAGYGDSGSMAVRGLCAAGCRAVVVDRDVARLQTLELDDFRQPVPGLCGDGARPDTLLIAGLRSKFCVGVLALTDNASANLQVTITARLLRPELPVIVRAETRDAEAALHSVGAEYVLNPFDLFARVVRHAVHAPSLYALDELLTSAPHEAVSRRVAAPRGHWIVCGYGRFGKTICDALQGEGIVVTVIEEDPDLLPTDLTAVLGRGTEPGLLVRAGLRDASALVAGTDNDATNLSIVLTARQLSHDIFIVARQNHRDNVLNFVAARIQLVLQRGNVLAGEVFTIATAPLVVEFLRAAEGHDEAWARRLTDRIRALVRDRNPERWTVNVRSLDAPAIARAIAEGQPVRIADIGRDPSRRTESLLAIALALKRGRTLTLLPDTGEVLHKGDVVLWCGTTAARHAMQRTARNYNEFHYVMTGEERADAWVRPLPRKRQSAPAE